MWPVVRSVSLRDANGEAITTVGAGKTTFTVTFNRDMDTEMPLQVRFGSSYPYADFEVAGQWLDSRTWEGSTTMTSLIANGIQYWSIANGRSAEGHLERIRQRLGVSSRAQVAAWVVASWLVAESEQAARAGATWLDAESGEATWREDV